MTLSDLESRKGYYQVGHQRFLNKVPAILEASRHGLFPQWVFMNELLDKYDWKTPPDATLSQLYRDRCQQLRDQYSWLTLSYSGGADSDNILRTFLDNNIRLDELLVLWPVQRSESLPTDAWDLAQSNWTSEWALTLKPRLRWLAQNHPHIKITVRDWAQELPHYQVKDDFLITRASMLSPYGVMRWHDRARLDRLAHKNGVLIYGTDKPRLCIRDGWYNIYFVDVAVQANQPEIDAWSDHVELFYWSPDTLDLVCKQAHTVIDFFQAHASLNPMLDWPIQAQWHEDYRNIVKSLIYPGTYDHFQVRHFAYDTIVDATELAGYFREVNARAWHTLRPLIQDSFVGTWDGQTQLTGMINGMWPVRAVMSTRRFS